MKSPTLTCSLCVLISGAGDYDLNLKWNPTKQNNLYSDMTCAIKTLHLYCLLVLSWLYFWNISPFVIKECHSHYCSFSGFSKGGAIHHFVNFERKLTALDHLQSCTNYCSTIWLARKWNIMHKKKQLLCQPCPTGQTTSLVLTWAGLGMKLKCFQWKHLHFVHFLVSQGG